MAKFCTLKFDGACSGNPGYGGAGAVILNSRVKVVSRVSKSLGLTTNNAAEYEGLIAGLERAIEMGFEEVHAMGDSLLVCKQVDGNWEIQDANLLRLFRRVKELIDLLVNFDISYIPSEQNTEADAEANKALSI